MALDTPFSMADVLAVAKIHPFYASNIDYPPEEDAIRKARNGASYETAESDLKSWPVLCRRTLYSTINRLIEDTNPQNTFRQSVYTSTTGGGTGSKPLIFVTDVYENRRARAGFGQFLRSIGLVSNSDWVVTTHSGGELYRSLDLTLEILENAGASVLAAGQHMLAAEVVGLMIKYRANVLSGESSQILSIVHYISTSREYEPERLKLNKIIYTSESLTPSQKMYIRQTLGGIQIFSILGSAEAGPYGVSCPLLAGDHWDTDTGESFVFDTRMTKIEILPLSFSDQDFYPELVKDGQRGMIAQTSLTRLRNPLVRYITGDIGSVHPLTEEIKTLVSEIDGQHLRILRLQGRDRRFSFEWDGNYFQFSGLKAMMNNTQTGVLQWQVVLDNMESTKEGSLKLRVFRPNHAAEHMSKSDLIHQIHIFFHVFSSNSSRFKLVFLEDDSTFERSLTSGKILQFINNYS